MSYSSLKNAVAQQIDTNEAEAITGQILQNVINTNLIPQLGQLKYKGLANPGDNPPAYEFDVFYFATAPGVYANFGGANITEGLSILVFSTFSGWSATSLFNSTELKQLIIDKTSKGGYSGTTQDLKDELDTAVFSGAKSYQQFSFLPDPDTLAVGTPAKVVNDPNNLLNGNYTVKVGANFGDPNVWFQDASAVSQIQSGEDIEPVGQELRLKDSVAGVGVRGRRIIRSNFDFTSIPSDYANSVWLIRHLHNLGGQNVAIPSGVTIVYDGGQLTNYGVITGNKTKIDCGFHQMFDVSGSFAGVWDLKDCHLEWFGALPDSSTVCTPAWLKMLSLINLSYSAHLKMANGSGRYLVGVAGVDSLEIDFSNTTIEGGKFFLTNYHFIKYATNVENFTIKNVDILVSAAVTGSNFNSGVITSSLGDLKNITYDNLTMKNEFKARSATGFNMINFNYNTDNVPDGTTMDNLVIKNCDIYIHGRNAYPIHIHKKTNNLIVKNNRVGTYSDGTDQFNGIGFNPIAIYANSYNFSVDSNTVIGAGHSGIACSAAEKGSITNNQVYDALANSEAGIEVEYKVGHGNLKGSNEVKISGNHVENCRYGVFITERDLTTSPSYAPRNVQILGNTFKNCLGAGIFMGIEAAGGSPIFDDNPNGVLICNNIFQGDLTLHPTASAIVCYYGKNIIISDNIIKDYRVGIWGGRHSNSKLSGMFKVSNNLITNCTNQAVFIETNSGEVDISNNQIKEVSDTAIKVNSTVDASTRLSICNNQIYDGNKGIEASAANTPKGIAIGNFCENMTGRGFKIGIANGILSNNFSLNTASVDQFVSGGGLIVNNHRV